MALAIDVLSWACLLAGGGSCIVGAVGMLRMPDLYTRIHAAGIIDSVGAGFILVGLMLQAGWTLTTGRLAVILVLLFFTSPVATHALARAARHRNVEPLLAAPAEEPAAAPRPLEPALDNPALIPGGGGPSNT